MGKRTVVGFYNSLSRELLCIECGAFCFSYPSNMMSIIYLNTPRALKECFNCGVTLNHRFKEPK